MAIVYTKARALLAVQATALSAEATAAGLSSLATALTDLATEITTNNGVGGATDAEFVGTNAGLFQIYTQELTSAAQIIRCKIENTIQTKLTSIDTSTAGIKTDMDSFKTDFDTMAANSTTMKNLAAGTGIHMVGPYDWIGFMSTYRLFVEQAKLSIDSTQNATPEQQAASLEILRSYITKVQSLPTLF